MRASAVTMAGDPVDDPYGQSGRAGCEELGAREVAKFLWQTLKVMASRPM